MFPFILGNGPPFRHRLPFLLLRSFAPVIQFFIMVKRNLRKQKRKDYEKLNNGVDGDLQNGEELSITEKSHADGEQNNNNNSLVEPGNGVDAEVLLDVDVDSDHEELEEAEKRLNILKKEKKKLLEKEKREYIARETKQVEKELKKLREKGKKYSDEKKDKEVTLGSLRGMRDVASEVDKLMDKKFSLKNTTTVASDSEKSYASSSSAESDSTGSDLEEIKKEKRGEESPRKKKSGGYRRSGKNRSSSSYVKYPQRWPHTQLALHFACTKEKKLEELSISEFCAGYITILETSSKDKMEHRRAHLEELMYLATKYQWENVLSYHAAHLTEI